MSGATGSIKWSPDTPEHVQRILNSLQAIEEHHAIIHSSMETLRASNEGVTITQMHETHLTLHQQGQQHFETIRDLANHTLHGYNAAQEQDAANATGVTLQ